MLRSGCKAYSRPYIAIDTTRRPCEVAQWPLQIHDEVTPSSDALRTCTWTPALLFQYTIATGLLSFAAT